MNSASTHLPTPEGPGSVSGAPNLPAGLTETFTSRYIDAGELRQHAVIGGDGPPLLLVHGWPEGGSPHRIARVGLAEIPGPPVASAAPPLFVPGPVNNRLWHIPFNRVDKVPEQLVSGREDISVP